jgi:hypothetical protein
VEVAGQDEQDPQQGAQQQQQRPSSSCSSSHIKCQAWLEKSNAREVPTTPEVDITVEKVRNKQILDFVNE